jgi:hypothetical protein
MVRAVTVEAEYRSSTHTMVDMIDPAWSFELHQIPFYNVGKGTAGQNPAKTRK